MKGSSIVAVVLAICCLYSAGSDAATFRYFGTFSVVTDYSDDGSGSNCSLQGGEYWLCSWQKGDTHIVNSSLNVFGLHSDGKPIRIALEAGVTVRVAKGADVSFVGVGLSLSGTEQSPILFTSDSTAELVEPGFWGTLQFTAITTWLNGTSTTPDSGLSGLFVRNASAVKFAGVKPLAAKSLSITQSRFEQLSAGLEISSKSSITLGESRIAGLTAAGNVTGILVAGESRLATTGTLLIEGLKAGATTTGMHVESGSQLLGSGTLTIKNLTGLNAFGIRLDKSVALALQFQNATIQGLEGTQSTWGIFALDSVGGTVENVTLLQLSGNQLFALQLSLSGTTTLKGITVDGLEGGSGETGGLDLTSTSPTERTINLEQVDVWNVAGKSLLSFGIRVAAPLVLNYVGGNLLTIANNAGNAIGLQAGTATVDSVTVNNINASGTAYGFKLAPAAKSKLSGIRSTGVMGTGIAYAVDLRAPTASPVEVSMDKPTIAKIQSENQSTYGIRSERIALTITELVMDQIISLAGESVGLRVVSGWLNADDLRISSISGISAVAGIEITTTGPSVLTNLWLSTISATETARGIQLTHPQSVGLPWSIRIDGLTLSGINAANSWGIRANFGIDLTLNNADLSDITGTQTQANGVQVQGLLKASKLSIKKLRSGDTTRGLQLTLIGKSSLIDVTLDDFSGIVANLGISAEPGIDETVDLALTTVNGTNLSAGSSNYGIQLEGDLKVTLSGIQLSGLTATAKRVAAIHLNGSSGTLDGATIKSTSGAPIVHALWLQNANLSASQLTISDVLSANKPTTSRAILLSDGSTLVLSVADVRNVGYALVLSDAGSTASLRRCRFSDYSMVALMQQQSSNATPPLLLDSSLIDNPKPNARAAIVVSQGIVRFSTLDGLGLALSGIERPEVVDSKLTLIGNMVTHFTTRGVQLSDADELLKNNLWSNGNPTLCNAESTTTGCLVALPPTNFSVDPRYHDPKAGDFRPSGLTPLSLFNAIDPTSLTTPLVAEDYFGAPRFGYYDVGYAEVPIVVSVEPASINRGAKLSLMIRGYNFDDRGMELQILTGSVADAAFLPNTFKGLKPLPTLDPSQPQQITLSLELQSDATTGPRNVWIANSNHTKTAWSQTNNALTVIDLPPEFNDPPTEVQCIAGQRCELEVKVCDPEGEALQLTPKVSGITLTGFVYLLVAPNDCLYRVSFNTDAQDTDGSLSLSVSDGTNSVTTTIDVKAIPNTAPDAPTLKSPAKNSAGVRLTETGALFWDNVTDPTPVPGSPTWYECYFSKTSDMSKPIVVDTKEELFGETGCTSDRLEENTWYYVQIVAYDGADKTLNSSSPVEVIFYNGDNEPPGQPLLKSPSNDSTVTDLANLTLVTFNTTDPEGDEPIYEFQLSTFEDFTTPLKVFAGIAQGTGGETSVKVSGVNLLDDQAYWFRVRALDKLGLAGPWSKPFRFHLNADNHAPTVPQLKTPTHESMLFDVLRPEFSFLNSSDFDGDEVSYQLELDTVDSFDSSDYQTFELSEGDNGLTRLLPSADFPLGKSWFWRVRASDTLGAKSNWSDTWSFQLRGPNQAPTTPVPVAPVDVELQQASAVEFVINNPVDPDGDSIELTLVLARDKNFSDVIATIPAIDPSDGEQTRITPVIPLLSEGDYYWHVRATDALGAISLWSKTVGFSVRIPTLEPSEDLVTPEPDAHTPAEIGSPDSSSSDSSASSDGGGNQSGDSNGSSCQLANSAAPTWPLVLLLAAFGLLFLQRRRS